MMFACNIGNSIEQSPDITIASNVQFASAFDKLVISTTAVVFSPGKSLPSVEWLKDKS